MEKLSCIIVGTGRSGTGYMAKLLSLNARPCGHEALFGPYGYTGRTDFELEASWFAVPYLSFVPKTTKIIHIVRHPENVIHSFYRMGAFARSPLQNFLQGAPLKSLLGGCLQPRQAAHRLCYYRAQKIFLGRHCSCLMESSELLKIEKYWCEWNMKIEEIAAK